MHLRRRPSKKGRRSGLRADMAIGGKQRGRCPSKSHGDPSSAITHIFFRVERRGAEQSRAEQSRELCSALFCSATVRFRLSRFGNMAFTNLDVHFTSTSTSTSTSRIRCSPPFT